MTSQARTPEEARDEAVALLRRAAAQRRTQARLSRGVRSRDLYSDLAKELEFQADTLAAVTYEKEAA